MPRAMPIDDRLASRRQVRLPARDLIACGAWQRPAPPQWGPRHHEAPWEGAIAPVFFGSVLAAGDFAGEIRGGEFGVAEADQVEGGLGAEHGLGFEGGQEHDGAEEV